MCDLDPHISSVRWVPSLTPFIEEKIKTNHAPETRSRARRSVTVPSLVRSVEGSWREERSQSESCSVGGVQCALVWPQPVEGASCDGREDPGRLRRSHVGAAVTAQGPEGQCRSVPRSHREIF